MAMRNVNDEKKDDVKDVSKGGSYDKKKDNRRKQGKGGSRNSESSTQRSTRNSSNTTGNQRVRDVTSINFDLPVSYELPDVVNPDTTGYTGRIAENNFFRVKYIPTLGSDLAANLSSQKLFGELRKVLNVPSRYEAGDLFMYVLAVQSLGEFIESMKRVIRLATTYKMHNILFPKAVLNMLGFDLNEVVTNLPNYREAVNKLVDSAKYLCIPTTFKAHALRLMLNSSVLTDEDLPKAQHIVFDPEGYWKWNVAAGTSTNPSSLEWVTFPATVNGKHGLADVISMGDTLLTSLLYDQDAQLIHGDILKVWGTNAVIVGGSYVSAEEIQETFYNPYILYMLHNATIAQGPGSTAPSIYWEIPTGGNSPVIKQKMYVNCCKVTKDWDIIDLPYSTPKGEDILDMVRWKYWTNAVVSDIINNNYKSDAELGNTNNTSVPLEILTRMEAYEFNEDLSVSNSVSMPTHSKSSAALVLNTLKSSVLAIRPIYYLKSNVGTSTSPIFLTTQLCGDRSYFTTLGPVQVGRMHQLDTELNYDLTQG